MRKNNKEAKETTRRLIKAGIAVGILGGGATVQMDAYALENEGQEPEASTALTPVDEYYSTVNEITGNDDTENQGSYDKLGENYDKLEDILDVNYSELFIEDDPIEYTDAQDSTDISLMNSEVESASTSEADKVSEEFSEATSAYDAAAAWLTDELNDNSTSASETQSEIASATSEKAEAEEDLEDLEDAVDAAEEFLEAENAYNEGVQEAETKEFKTDIAGIDSANPWIQYNSTHQDDYAKNAAADVVQTLKDQKELADTLLEKAEAVYEEGSEELVAIQGIVSDLEQAILDAEAQSTDVAKKADAFQALLDKRNAEIKAYNDTWDKSHEFRYKQQDIALAQEIVKYNLTVEGATDVKFAATSTDKEFTLTYKDAEGKDVSKTINYTIDTENQHSRGNVENSAHWLIVNEVVGEEVPNMVDRDYYVERDENGVEQRVADDVQIKTGHTWGGSYSYYETEEPTTKTVVTGYEWVWRYGWNGWDWYLDATTEEVPDTMTVTHYVSRRTEKVQDGTKTEYKNNKLYTEDGIAFNVTVSSPAITKVEYAQAALDAAEEARDAKQDEIDSLDEKLNGKLESDSTRTGGLHSESTSLNNQKQDLEDASTALSDSWSEYNENSTARSEDASEAASTSTSIYDKLVYVAPQSEAPTSENPASNNDNDNDNESAAATEGGSVLGANREQPVEETVVEEEGGKVLGAERGRSPKTNDAANVLGAVATMGSSLAGAGAVLGLRRRNR